MGATSCGFLRPHASAFRVSDKAVQNPLGSLDSRLWSMAMLIRRQDHFLARLFQSHRLPFSRLERPRYSSLTGGPVYGADHASSVINGQRPDELQFEISNISPIAALELFTTRIRNDGYNEPFDGAHPLEQNVDRRN